MKLNPYVLAISAALAMMAPSSGAVAQDAAAPAAQPSPDATATPAAPAAATGPVNAAPAAAAEANKTPGTNWLKVCDPLPSGKKVCIVRQIVVANNKVIGSLIIRQNPDLRSPFLAIGAVPVGVALAPGVSWRIDGGKAVTLPYSQCDPQTCVSPRTVNAAFINSLKKGKKLTLTAKTGAGKDFSIDIVLAGFGDTYDSADSITFEQLRKGEASAAAPPATPAPATPAPETPAPAIPAK